MGQKETGFSLIELLIVVAIILIIAAIAIPSYMRSKMQANEASAAQSLRSVNTAETTYSTLYGTGFAPLPNLGGATPCVPAPATACILDGVLSGGSKSGYNFAMGVPGALGTVAAPNVSYTVSAVPMRPGLSGERTFCTDQSNVIRSDPTGAVPPSPCDSGGLTAIQ